MLVPSAVIEVGEAVIVEVAVLGIPLETKVTVSVSVIAVPLNVPDTTADAGDAEDVSVAVKVAFPLLVNDESVPAVVESTGVQGLVVKLFPAPSFNCIVSVAVLVPLAAIDDVDDVIKLVAAEATSILIGVLGKLAQPPLLTSLLI